MEPNVVYGPPAPVPILENLNVPLPDYLLKYSLPFYNSVCMVDGISKREITSGMVTEISLKIAVELQIMGCKSGHIVGVISENRLEFPALSLGILRSGATLCCFNPAYSLGELQHTMNVVQPFALFVSSTVLEKLQTLRKKFSCLKYIINLDAEKSCKTFLSYKSIAESKNVLRFVRPKIHGDDTALVLFSSGSTGLPKGVMLSHQSLVMVLDSVRFRSIMLESNCEKKITLSIIPMFHGYGVLLLLKLLIINECVVVLSRFEEKLFLQTIQDYKVTSLPLVPALMVFLAKHPLVGEYDLSSVSDVSCGAAPLSPSIEQEVKTKLKLAKVNKGYGMTETTIICTFTALSEDKPGTVGKLMPAMAAKVVDLQTGEALGPNKEGEIWFKGLFIMQGYYNNEKATKETIDNDGWLHTGDVGYYDEDEDFYVVDRIKDLIKYKGFQVPPAELETLLLQHSAVKDAAVIGIPNEISGEVPRAFVVKQKDVTEDELCRYVADNVGPHMRLRGGLIFLQTIPRNANGKILKKDLRAWSVSKL